MILMTMMILVTSMILVMMMVMKQTDDILMIKPLQTQQLQQR